MKSKNNFKKPKKILNKRRSFRYSNETSKSSSKDSNKCSNTNWRKDFSFNKTINSENLSKEFTKNGIILNDISKISCNKNENKSNLKNSESDENSEMLRSLSLDNSNLSENSKYSDYLDDLIKRVSPPESLKRSSNNFSMRDLSITNLSINLSHPKKNSFQNLSFRNKFAEDDRNKSFLVKNNKSFDSFNNTSKMSKKLLEDTQMSFFSDLSIDDNLQNSFMNHFGSSKFHEKFFKKRINDKKVLKNSISNEFISLKMFKDRFLQTIEKNFWIYKSGLRDSTKNTFAKEIVVGRVGNHLLNIHDIALSRNNKSVSRLHCFIDCHFHFRGTFKLTKNILNLFLCLRKKKLISKNIWFKIIQFVKKPKKTILYDLNSKTGTLLKLKTQIKLLTENLKFYIGDDANFRVDAIKKEMTILKLKNLYPNSVLVGFNNSQVIYKNILILKVENASSNLLEYLILQFKEGKLYSIGRAPENEININLTDVSRIHSIIKCWNNQWWLKDGKKEFNSLAGTWIDIATIRKVQRSLSSSQDLIEQRCHQKHNFKGIELQEKDQFKVGSKTFEISFFINEKDEII